MLGLSIKLNKSVLTSQAYGLTSGTERVFEGIIQKSEDWNNYETITAVFTQGPVVVPVPVLNDSLIVPTENLKPGACDIHVVGTKYDTVLMSKVSNIFIYEGVTDVEIPTDIWTKYVEIMNVHLQEVLDIEKEIEDISDRLDKTVTEETNNINKIIKLGTDEITQLTDIKSTELADLANDFNEDYKQMTDKFNSNAGDKTSIINGLKDDMLQIKEQTEAIKNETDVLNDEVEINANEVEENTITVRECKEIVEQAMHDMLSMMNDKIATLVDGKLNPDQIPDLAIANVTWVKDAESISELTNQQIGDIVYVTDEGDGPGGDIVDAFINVGESEHGSEWRKLSTSFVANAGHANTATTAVDSGMINGKRIVSMTMSEYISAVTDDSYYMIKDFEDGDEV